MKTLNRMIVVVLLIALIVILTTGCKGSTSDETETQETIATTETETTEATTVVEETVAEETVAEETVAEETTEAKVFTMLSAEMKSKLESATPTYVDTFEGGSHSPESVSSSFYSATLPSTQNVEYVEGKDSGGILLTAYDSYVGYPAGILNANEGTIRFYFKPQADVYSAYNTRADVWLDYGSIAPPFSGFILDTVGWATAYPGSASAFIGFKEADATFSYANFGTFSGRDWSYAGGELPKDMILNGDQWIDILLCYSQSKNKIAIYFDGTLLGEAPFNTGMSTSEGFFLGQTPWPFMGLTYWPYGPHTMKGTYSNLRIYNEAFCD